MSGVGGIGGTGPSWIEGTPESDEVPSEPGESVLALVLDPTATSATASTERASEDAATTASVAAKLAVLGDPLALQFLAQSWIRDLRVEVREGSAAAADSAATTAAENRDALLREAERLAAEARTSGDISRVFSVIGAAIALAAGTIGAVFSGGATLVGAVGLAIAVLGPLVTSELSRAGVIDDPNVATGIGLGCAVVGSIMSFGAGSGSLAATGADAAAKVAIQVTMTTLKVASAAAQAGSGGADVAAAAYTRESTHRELDSDVAETVRESSRDDVTAAHEDIVDFIREAARTSERLRAVTEARTAALRAAVGTRA